MSTNGMEGKSTVDKTPDGKTATGVKTAAAKLPTPKSGAKPRAKKARLEYLTLCNKCGGEIFRSSFRNFGEVIMGPILLPFRCSRCGWRQFRSSFSRVRDKSNYRRAATDQ